MKKIPVLIMVCILAVAVPIAAAQEIGVPRELGVDLEGKVFDLKEHVGKENLYLVFWTTWCRICEGEIPNLIDTHNKVEEVRLVAVNPGFNDSLARTQRYKEKFDLPYQIIFDETGLSAQAFGVYGVPTAILINKKGEIVYVGYPLHAEEVAEIISKAEGNED